MEITETWFKLLDIAISLFILSGVLYFGYKEFKSQRADFLKMILEKDKVIAAKEEDLINQLKSTHEILTLFSASFTKIEDSGKVSVVKLQELHNMADKRLTSIGQKLQIEDANYYS